MDSELTQLNDKVDRLIELIEQQRRSQQMIEELVQDAWPVANAAVKAATRELAELDRRGVFAFAREGLRVADRIVAEFSAEDVRALGDNVVTILSTVRNMTQPDLMALANRAADTLHDAGAADGDASMWTLLREMGDPQVRRGLARMLRVVRTFADQPDSVRSN